MMKTLTLMLLLFHVATPAKYYVDVDQLISSGIQNIEEFMVAGIVEGVTTFFYDDTMTTAKVTHGWMKNLVKNHSQPWEIFIQDCIDSKPVFEAETENFNKRANETGGGNVIQQVVGCEWDDETNEVVGYIRYGNNGEDFISFDMNTETWIASNAQAETVKQEWDKNSVRNELRKNFLITDCPRMLQMSLSYGKTYLTRKELPSVSLLQKTPSSPVSCHATGFYPDEGLIFWRKDGEEIHEGVEHGNILPNPDESFQMSVDLNVSSIPSEDWMRYDCVFEMSGVQNVIIMNLDKDVIESNYKEPGILGKEDNLSVISIAVIAVMAVLIVIILAALGFMTHKKRAVNVRPDTPSSDTASDTISL